MSGRRSVCFSATAALALIGPVFLNVQSQPAAGAMSIPAVRKGDRAAIVTQAPLAAVASAMTAGGSRDRVVIMRDAAGQIVYRSDAATSVTRASRGVQFTSVPVPTDEAQPAPSQPAATRPTHETRTRVPVGCDRLVSSLVKSAAASSRIGRCIT